MFNTAENLAICPCSCQTYVLGIHVGPKQVLKEEELQTQGLVLLVDARDVGFSLLRHFKRECCTTQSWHAVARHLSFLCCWLFKTDMTPVCGSPSPRCSFVYFSRSLFRFRLTFCTHVHPFFFSGFKYFVYWCAERVYCKDPQWLSCCFFMLKLR